MRILERQVFGLCIQTVNYFRWLIRGPNRLILGVMFFNRALFNWTLRRVGISRSSNSNMPSLISRLRCRVLSNHVVCPTVYSKRAYLGLLQGIELVLIGRSIEYVEGGTWTRVFDDEEETTALHRWGWLLRSLTDGKKITREQGLYLMRDWVITCEADKNMAADAYSSAERISNGALFLRLTGDCTVPKDIQLAFERMGRSVARYLEYHPGDRTGNHAFNNARGIFIAGVIVGDEDMIALANAIFRERLPVIVTSDGFLREASSHYHFLFTRWVLEVLWFADVYGQVETQQIFRPYVSKLVERCWFFLVRSRESGAFDIPLIGDISPDFPPDWLISLPWCQLAVEHYGHRLIPIFRQEKNGWASLFGFYQGQNCAYQEITTYFPQSGWFRLSHEEMTLFCFAEGADGNIRADHKHDDLCSFVCFYRGEVFLIDCGRLNYTPSVQGYYGKSIYAHNSLTVDGMSPSVEPKSWIAPAYSSVQVNATVTIFKHGIKLILEHDGFRRIVGKQITHRREICLDNARLRIQDSFGGNGLIDVRLRFHVAMPWLVRSEPKIYFDPRLRETFQVAFEGVNGLCVRQYGVSGKCKTHDLTGSLPLPTSITNTFDWT